MKCGGHVCTHNIGSGKTLMSADYLLKKAPLHFFCRHDRPRISHTDKRNLKKKKGAGTNSIWMKL